VPPSQVRTGCRQAVGFCKVYGRVNPGSFANDGGKEVELTHGAGPLTLQPRPGQAGLPLDQVVPEGEDFAAHSLQKPPPCGRRQLTEFSKGLGGKLTGPRDVLSIRLLE